MKYKCTACTVPCICESNLEFISPEPMPRYCVIHKENEAFWVPITEPKQKETKMTENELIENVKKINTPSYSMDSVEVLKEIVAYLNENANNYGSPAKFWDKLKAVFQVLEITHNLVDKYAPRFKPAFLSVFKKTEENTALSEAIKKVEQIDFGCNTEKVKEYTRYLFSVLKAEEDKK